jgi:RimJ/RimL family protein N-acetyltransferase
MAIPSIESDRLTLRPVRDTDLVPYANFYASEGSRFVGGPCSREETWRKLAAIVGHWHLRGYGPWALECKEDGLFAGLCGLWFPEGWPEPEIMWLVTEDYQNHGFATEAAARVRDHAAKTLGWQRLVSCIEAENASSVRVASHLGAVLEYRHAMPPPDGRRFDVYVHQMGANMP